ncbi:MAG: IS21 family transposase [Mariniphaga sp.]|nr:IS21 family transposase [Mariniphaga sp.]
MANKTTSMTQLKRIIQLKSEGYSKLSISQKLGLHRKTLDDYLKKFDSTGESYQELMGRSDEYLSNIVFNSANTRVPDTRYSNLEKKFPYFNVQLEKTGVTRLLLWKEYKIAYPDGYSYTQFCEHFYRYNKCNKATMHFEHPPGEYLQADFAGKPLYLTKPSTGEIIPCPVLVCILPCSSYPYVEALASTRQEHLFEALSKCLEHLEGVPRNILSYNMKQYIKKNNKYEFKFSDLADQWALHYNTNLVATRPRKPKDKPSVENNVYISYLSIYAKLRNEVFTNLFDLNQRIMELVEQHIRLPFQKQDGTRLEKFIKTEKPLLKPLPLEPFKIKHITWGKVQMNYHVFLGEDNHRYSVPYQYIGQSTKIIYDLKDVEIFIGFNRIAMHPRDYRSGGYTTVDEHMPKKHLKYKESLGWDANYFLSVGKQIGESSEEVFRKVLASKEFVEQTYLSCKGLKRLSEIYGSGRLERACKRALKGSRVNYGMIKNILEKNLDQLEENQLYLFSIPEHENIRGEGSFK